jgi:release factor glutamine methyltransferase
MTTTIGEALRLGAARLACIADNPRLEARLLLSHVLGISTANLIRDSGQTIDPTAFDALTARRLAHVPLAYLTGHREFWSLDLEVSPATLIPRPDSETIVAAALRAVVAPARVLDLGTGSGCLLLAVLRERPGAFGIGVDRSTNALVVARRNARRLGMGDRVAFVAGDWMNAIGGRFDLILANPPYIPTDEIGTLMPEVAWHEPRTALDGGTDGLEAYRRIIPALPAHLTSTGVAVLEIGIGQGDPVSTLARAAGLGAEAHPDLAGIARALVLRRSDGRD